MPRRARVDKARHRKLTMHELFDLTTGPNPHRPAFDSDEERREAWFAHRDQVVAAVNATMRPQAFWDYEVPHLADDDIATHRPGETDWHGAIARSHLLGEARERFLEENQLLSEAEREALQRRRARAAKTTPSGLFDDVHTPGDLFRDGRRAAGETFKAFGNTPRGELS